MKSFVHFLSPFQVFISLLIRSFRLLINKFSMKFFTSIIKWHFGHDSKAKGNFQSEAYNGLILVYRSLQFDHKSDFFHLRVASKKQTRELKMIHTQKTTRIKIYFYDFNHVIIQLPSVVAHSSISDHKQAAINFVLPSTWCNIKFHDKTFEGLNYILSTAVLCQILLARKIMFKWIFATARGRLKKNLIG